MLEGGGVGGSAGGMGGGGGVGGWVGGGGGGKEFSLNGQMNEAELNEWRYAQKEHWKNSVESKVWRFIIQGAAYKQAMDHKMVLFFNHPRLKSND